MALIIPPDYNLPGNGGLQESERQTLEYLAEALPDTYTVFSSVLWARSHAQNTRFGEIDFCVVSPAGQLVVIEQKSGGLIERDGQIYKRYGVKEKNAGDQLLRSIAALKDVWQKQHQGQTVSIDYLLYLPDHSMRNLNGLQLDASRIVHASSAQSLNETIQAVCGELPADKSRVAVMHDFLTGVLELELDIGRLQSHQDRLYRRYEDTLLAWVMRLDFLPYVLRVDGCAGSGKTQLGLGIFREARTRGEEARYICFNRPLADSLARAANDPERILNRDRFYDLFLKSQQAVFDFDNSDGNLYERLEAQVASLAIPQEWLVDLLVIDEGQDMPQRSLDVLMRFLRPGGRLVWLEDKEQNLYRHEAVVLIDAVELRLDQCFRSPVAILKFMTTLFAIKRPVLPANPHYGEEPGFFTVENEQLTTRLAGRLQELSSRGVPLKDIAIISLHGLSRSALKGMDMLGDFSLSHFTGSYTPDGQQVWTDGDIVFDSIYRFKGSQRPFILLIDADFNAITEDVVRRFYCGMTRATLGVDVFMAPACEAALRESLA